MKKLLMLLIVFPIMGYAQYFSGEITYQIKIIPKSDTVDIKKIMDLKHGTTAKYVIEPGRYKSMYFKDNEYKYSYTYDEASKRMYDDYSNKPYITYRDSQKANYDYYDSKVFKDSTSNILSFNCYMVLTKSEYGTSRTFYSDDVRVNYSDFEGHKVGNWYNKLKEVNGAITLKTITEHDSYYEIQEAINIEERKVGSNEFLLPDKPVAAAFSALDTQVELIQPTSEQINCYQEKVTKVSNKEGEKFVSYISFLLEKDGEINFIEPYEEDEHGFYKIAVDIVQKCGFKFKSGLINGEQVDSQVFFPIEFAK